MKRAVVVVLGLLALLVPAQAAHAEDCLTVPELPGECLSEATYLYVTQVQGEAADGDAWRQKYQDQAVELQQTQWALLDSQMLAGNRLGQIQTLTASLTQAQALAEKRWQRILVLRGKVISLRAQL